MQHPTHQLPRTGQHSPVLDDRPLLMNIAFRMLGSMADAQDAVQEGFVRWYSLTEPQRGDIASPTAWLVKATTRICLDVLGSARVRRERYAGPWLPEPLPDPARWSSHAGASRSVDPADQVVVDESVSMALLVVCETMTPPERVAFVLHDVFRYSFAEIGDILGRSPGACRQLASSARRRLRRSGIHPASGGPPAVLVGAFKAAWETGDLTALLNLLDPGVTAIADGGGHVGASLVPILGRDDVARFMREAFDRQPGLTIAETLVNGQPGLVGMVKGAIVAAVAFGVANNRISHIWVVRNPEKLASWRS